MSDDELNELHQRLPAIERLFGSDATNKRWELALTSESDAARNDPIYVALTLAIARLIQDAPLSTPLGELRRRGWPAYPQTWQERDEAVKLQAMDSVANVLGAAMEIRRKEMIEQDRQRRHQDPEGAAALDEYLRLLNAATGGPLFEIRQRFSWRRLCDLNDAERSQFITLLKQHPQAWSLMVRFLLPPEKR